MNTPYKTYMNWSSGKDASMALHALMQNNHYTVDRLLTSINSHHNRVSMHGLRRELLTAQANAIGLPLQTIELPESPDMETYNAAMQQTVSALTNEGYTHCGFGDIFLEDLKDYRVAQLKPYGIECQFPLWKKDTKALIQDFIAAGFKAIVVCINANVLDASFVGRTIDANFVNDLPEGVDPCGENGEFHTFCYDGPIFQHPVAFTIGEKVYREYDNPQPEEEGPDKYGFWFCDLIPDEVG